MSPRLAVPALLLALLGPAVAAAADESSVALADFLARQAETRRIANDAFAQMPLPGNAGVKANEKPCADSDGDGLSDCVESGTGRFRNQADTGTSPTLPDTDGDGIRDGDEVNGTPWLNLPALGVSPVRKDLLLEYDWVEDGLDCAAHSHKPSAAAIAKVAEIYANAPVRNPDGSTGIHVIQDYGQGGAFTGGQRLDGVQAVLPGAFDSYHAQLKQKFFAPERAGYFHYVLFAHRYAGGSNSSGYAEIVGDDVLVTLYCYATNDTFVANTIVHEVGHNLGLLHGGFEACNGKPNYSSLMNYRYQFAGTDAQCTGYGTTGAADLSHGDRMPLDERAADERLGVCGSPGVDWNSNGVLEPSVAVDVNATYNSECGSALRILDDFDDWQNLDFAGVLDGVSPQFKSVQTEVACGGAPPQAKADRTSLPPRRGG